MCPQELSFFIDTARTHRDDLSSIYAHWEGALQKIVETENNKMHDMLGEACV